MRTTKANEMWNHFTIFEYEVSGKECAVNGDSFTIKRKTF